jgi:hypothetical protein
MIRNKKHKHQKNVRKQQEKHQKKKNIRKRKTSENNKKNIRKRKTIKNVCIFVLLFFLFFAPKKLILIIRLQKTIK